MSMSTANNFCSACGNSIINTAVICPKCGSPTPKYRPETVHVGKSKTTAVVLSVFLSIWSWLYTYKVNAHKFWITFSLALALFVTIMIVAWQSYVAPTYEAQDQLRALVSILGPLWQILVLGSWLWALLDNATKPRAFYLNYGSKSQI
jgi:hypothetical protein